MRVLTALALVCGCTAADDTDWVPRKGRDKDTGTPGTPTGWTTTDTGDAGETYETTTVLDCSALPEGPVSYAPINIATEEDFDFNLDGYALYQDGSNLVGHDQYGDIKVIAPNVASDPSGIAVLADNNVLVGAQDLGNIKWVDATTGANLVLVSGLTQVNGLEVGNDDKIYYSEFTTNGSVRWYDMVTEETGVVVPNTYMPNGIVLSPDEQILYIGGSTDASNRGILAVDRNPDGSWALPPREVYTSTVHDYDAVEVDMCGNVYTVEFSTGRLLRISPDGQTVTTMADLVDPQGGWDAWNAARWGNGRGGWRRDVLYVTNRNHLFAVEVGVLGKPNPTAVLP